MRQFQTILTGLLALVMLLSLCACQGSAPAETATVSTQPTTQPVCETTAPTEPQWTPFTGTDYKYVYYYEHGRSRDWEEDIIYMASNYIDDYGLISKYPFRIEWPDDVEYSDQFFDPELQQYWIDETNAMILDIPNMTDLEILYRIQKLVATLGDAHASVYLPTSRYFPIYFYPFFHEDGVDVHVIGTRKETEQLMYARLEAVNGIPLEEVVELMRPYISYENDYWMLNLIFNAYGHSYIIWEDFLRITGIMPEGAETVTYRLVSQDGEVTELELAPVKNSTLGQMRIVVHSPYAAYELMYSNYHNYWYQYLDEEDMIYVRINRFEEDYSYTFLTMGNEILKFVREKGGSVSKLVVDLRDNPGGYTFAGYHEFVTILNRIQIDSVYVLVDGNTFSNGILMASTIKRMIPDAVLVGTHAGQPPNFFAGMSDGDYVMSNCDTIIRMPTAYYVPLPGYEGDTLLPDVLVYPTLEDYINGVDTILEAVKDIP